MDRLTEPISPELVLVDPELAERLRRSDLQTFQHVATPPAPTVRPPAPIVRRPAPTVPPVKTESPADGATGDVSAETERRRPARGRALRGRIATVATLCAIVLLGAAAFLPPRDAPRLLDRTSPAAAAPSESPAHPRRQVPAAVARPGVEPAASALPQRPHAVPAPQASRRSHRPAPAAAPSDSLRLRLAWRPTGGSAYYLVEIFAGTRIVHAETTVKAALLIPKLPPGRYTWRVFSGDGATGAARPRSPIEHGWFIVRSGR